MNDVRVVSLIGSTVHLLDISFDVPQGQTVTVPADKAARSKDLWRLIAQKQLFRLNPGPGAPEPPPPPPMSDADRLREENRLLLDQNRLLRQAIDNQGGKLDAILARLESQSVVVAPQQAGVPVKATSDLVEIETPTYIPTEIKLKDVTGRVEVKAEMTEGSGVEGAGAALRKLRRGGLL